MKIRGLAMGITIFVTLCSLNLIIPALSAGLESTPSPGTQTEPTRYQQEELRQIVAPIALYPDPLLAQIFMASTYPIEVVLASRWLKEKRDLKDDALDSALKEKEWDASVKSLVHFPEVLFLLNDNLEWTNKLGIAFLNQRKELMEAAQYLRQRAKEEGNLRTTPEQNVLMDDQVIRIEPAYSTVVYVPAYNPAVVYGSWYYPVTPWFVYPVSPWVYPVPYGFWWGYPNWFCYNIYVHDDDCHDDCDDHHDGDDDHHDGDHHDGDKNKNDNHGRDYNRGKDFRDGKGNGKGNWKEWQHDSTRGKFFASRDRGTIQRSNQDSLRSREARTNLQALRQKAPDRQRAAVQRTRENMVSAWGDRQDNRNYNLSNISQKAQVRFQTRSAERGNTIRGSSGGNSIRTETPRIQSNTAGRSYPAGSLGGVGIRIGRSFSGGTWGGSISSRSSGGFIGGSISSRIGSGFGGGSSFGGGRSGGGFSGSGFGGSIRGGIAGGGVRR